MTNAVRKTNRRIRKGERRDKGGIYRILLVFLFVSLFFSSLPAMRIARAILLQNSTGGTLPRSRPRCPTHRAHVIAYAWVYTPWAPICRKYSDPSSVSRSLHMYLYVILEPSRFLGNGLKIFSCISVII